MNVHEVLDNLQYPVGDKAPQYPTHLQLMDRHEYMKKIINQDVNKSTTSLGSLSPASSLSDASSDGSPSWGKHRYSTYYERLPFFKNPFSPHVQKKQQKLSYMCSEISPDATKFVLVSESKWLVYGINKLEPSLLCCGKINGESGVNFDALSKQSLIPSADVQFKMCSLSERFLVLVCTDGSLRVYDILEAGRLFYQYDAGLPIESVSISPKNNLIACGLQGRNKHTRGSIMLLISFEFKTRKLTDGLTSEVMEKIANLQKEFTAPPPPQPLFLRKLNSKSSLRSLRKAAEKSADKPITITAPIPEMKLLDSDSQLITLPYKGIVDNVKFSSDGTRLVFSTFKDESKFVVFDVTSTDNIQLIMKSSRSPDSSLGSEGITDFQLFGYNDEFMMISSNSSRAPPMILRTNIKDFKLIKTTVQPSRVLKLDSVGSNIHKCCTNSTNDLMAFLATDGKIWLAQLSKDNKIGKLEIIDKVTGSSCYKNTASMKFSKDGTKMFIVDLKGVLFVQDFSKILQPF